MKKLLSVLLSVLMIFSAVSVSFSAFAADENGFTAAVVSDIHLSNVSSLTLQEEAFAINSAAGIKNFGDAFLKQFAKEVRENNDIDVVFITGDIVADPSGASDALRILESIGKPIYAVPGSADAMSKVYSFRSFGYDDAIATIPENVVNTNSYVADIPGTDYRVLALDTTEGGSLGGVLSEETLAWVEEQCKAGADAKRHMIAIMHHNMLDHFTYDGFMDNAYLENGRNLAEVFAKYDVKYVFSGHTHANSIKEFEGENGNKVFETVTSALNAYPLAYNVVSFSDKNVSVKLTSISDLDTSSLNLSEKEMIEVNADFMGYAHKAMRENLAKALIEFFNKNDFSGDRNFLQEMFEISKSDPDPEVQKCALVLEKVANRMVNGANAPIYKSLKTENDRISLEEIVAQQSQTEVKLPKTEPLDIYKNFVDVLAYIYELHITGYSKMDMSSDEFFILINSLAGLINYGGDIVSQEEYGKFLQYLVTDRTKIGVFLPLTTSIYTQIMKAVTVYDQCRIYITYLFSPFIVGSITSSYSMKETVKLAPYTSFNPAPDSDTEKPGDEPTGTSFRDRFVAFFNRIIEAIKMAFRAIFG